MSHRGPDDYSSFQDQKISLFHNRLQILGSRSGGRQPMASKDNNKRFRLVFNGEIYNFRELQEKYKLKNSSNSDTEILLQLLALQGKEILSELRGIYALAFYDRQDSKLLLARDPFGVKPLFYKQKEGLIAFASEMRALIEKRTQFNESAIFHYLQSGLLLHNQATFFEEILQFPPGHCCELNLNNKETVWTKFHKLKRPQWSELIRDPQEASNLFAQHFQRAIERNLVSDVELAISLSSGIDSFLIASFLKKSNTQLRAFSFGFEELEYDEVNRLHPSIKESLCVTPCYLSKSEFLPALQEATYFFESPLGGLGTLSAFKLNKLVKSCKIKVLLSGEGSDENFAGYKYYLKHYLNDLANRNEERLLMSEITAYNKRFHDQLNLRDFISKGNIQDEIEMLAPDGTTLSSRYLGKRFDSSYEQSSISIQGDSSLSTRMLSDLYSLKLPKLLHFQDRASMANSIENRVPFLDEDLVQFASSLHPSLLIKDSLGKALFPGVLKQETGIDWKEEPKHFVATPQREWLKDPKIQAEILETTRYGKSFKDDWIDFERFEKQYNEYVKSPILGNSFFVWKVISLEYFLKTNYQNPQAT